MMNLLSPSLPSVLVFLVLVVFCVGAALVGLHRAGTGAGRWAVGLLGWVAITGALAGAGLLEQFSLPPPLLGLLLAMTVGIVVFVRSETARRLVEVVPVWALLLVQAFRLPLEVVLVSWNAEGALPAQLTYHGYNFDIATGVLALLATGLWGAGLGRGWVPQVFNGIGLVCLAVIVLVALGSMPTPLQWMDAQPPLVLPARFPFVWLPMVCVGFAFATHLLSLKQWLRSRAA